MIKIFGDVSEHQIIRQKINIYNLFLSLQQELSHLYALCQ